MRISSVIRCPGLLSGLYRSLIPDTWGKRPSSLGYWETPFSNAWWSCSPECTAQKADLCFFPDQCQGWPTESLPQRLSGCIVTKISALTRVPLGKGHSMGGSFCINYLRQNILSLWLLKTPVLDVSVRTSWEQPERPQLISPVISSTQSGSNRGSILRRSLLVKTPFGWTQLDRKVPEFTIATSAPVVSIIISAIRLPEVRDGFNV